MEKHISIQNHQVFYETTQEGQNAIVFLHD